MLGGIVKLDHAVEMALPSASVPTSTREMPMSMCPIIRGDRVLVLANA